MASDDVVDVIETVRSACDGRRVLLAVSGGVDSMVMLDAAQRASRGSIVAVATFDHGTGAFARQAADLVAATCARLGVAVVVGRAAEPGATEAAWRDARWRFLREMAAALGAEAIATAHTRDDQIETIAMRAMRHAGARGLAGLAAPSRGVIRPLLGVGRAAVVEYAAVNGVAWLEDPSNASHAHLRNRLRADLLPAVTAVRPALAGELLEIGRQSAAWRADVEAFVDAHVSLRLATDGALHVATPPLRRYDARSLAALWPAIAARAGVRLDRRGTERLTQFSLSVAAGGKVGLRMQLSGAVGVRATRDEIVLQPRGLPAAVRAHSKDSIAVSLADTTELGPWRFRRADTPLGEPRWAASLPRERALSVRSWRPGDRMRAASSSTARRVKRFFADAGVAGDDRAGWPVVLAGEEIVWIPGVRRSDAATDRPGRSGVLYICERRDC